VSHFDLSPDLLREVGQLAAEAAVIAEAPASPANEQRGARGAPASKEPTGHSWSLHDAIVRRSRGCVTDTHLREVIVWAKVSITKARIGPRPEPESDFERDKRILNVDVDKAPDEVAAMEGLSEKDIRGLRTRNGRNAETGRPIDDVDMSKATDAERIVRVERLHDQSVSHRLIAEKLHLTKWRVEADIRVIRARRAREQAEAA
jgi:hypothetical protein